jgi:hypothetical protein
VNIDRWAICVGNRILLPLWKGLFIVPRRRGLANAQETENWRLFPEVRRFGGGQIRYLSISVHSVRNLSHTHVCVYICTHTHGRHYQRRCVTHMPNSIMLDQRPSRQASASSSKIKDQASTAMHQTLMHHPFCYSLNTWTHRLSRTLIRGCIDSMGK